MCFFGGIGTWLFGEYRQDFATFSVSMQTLFAMMFGSFIPGWTQSTITMVYTVGAPTDRLRCKMLDSNRLRGGRARVQVSYMMIVFLLVLSFLLAIIVEAYMKVRLPHRLSAMDEIRTHSPSCAPIPRPPLQPPLWGLPRIVISPPLPSLMRYTLARSLAEPVWRRYGNASTAPRWTTSS
jgi:hypothetical protein